MAVKLTGKMFKKKYRNLLFDIFTVAKIFFFVVVGPLFSTLFILSPIFIALITGNHLYVFWWFITVPLGGLLFVCIDDAKDEFL